MQDNIGFTFNDLHCSEFGLYANVVSNPLKATKIVNEEFIMGKSKPIKFDTGNYESKILVIDCVFFGKTYEERRQITRYIAEWLNIKGKLILDTEKDKCYIANAYSQIDIETSPNLDTFTVDFECESFQTSDYDDSTNTYNINGAKNITLENIGTYESQTIIKLVGNGNVTVTNNINNQTFTYNNLNNEEITIDSDNMVVYRLDIGTKINKLSNYEGDFITLEKGLNTLNIIGNMTIKIEYQDTYL